jgi:phenylalanyl-tRNA synthetase beta chain
LTELVSLVELLGCGKVSDGAVDCYPTKRQVSHIPYRPDRINSFIGIDADDAFMRSTLKLLGCDIVSENGVETIVPPTYRPDLEGEADISEEIARFYGYNRIVPTLLSGQADDTRAAGQLSSNWLRKSAIHWFITVFMKR